ncbi:alcohol dehydrogenase, zinc-containing [Aspergillus clavatus NRRL 1]|uniref:Alcohol dehydrogenase, zinc-containing n=1 Tax=Aspergillus clavatus (strain ATCC 1007 / CBS 513.65 / DSM 816 / NCTC 3887 / NRRL 1 / QM 1276 / 107) TaxID=344612 RepID=A1C7T1_ASPCL|nr:alcohol dehydrogenase, zinc-containing [Aspergillus clavatus NRRL 1]EAW14452.1 alcohol dehydrogenase, zinc-containing [Aspergillus clavatus NRRL 1]
MREVRFHGCGDIRVEQIDEPVCGEGQRARNHENSRDWAGEEGLDPTCLRGYLRQRSYPHEYLHGPITIPRTAHSITGGRIPVTVAEIGPGVTRVKFGDRVAVKPNLYDGTCSCCVTARPNCCRNMAFIGLSNDAGGLSDQIVVGEKHAILLPEGFPLDLGALVEPLTGAWLNRSSVRPGDTVLVVGGGPIGLAVVQVLKAHSIKSIVVSEVSPQRQLIAKVLGASKVLDPRTQDVVAMVRAMTAGPGPPLHLSAPGCKPAWTQPSAGFKCEHVIGSVIYEDGDFEAVIDAISSGKLSPQDMITCKEDVVERGFKALIDERDKHVKILVDVSA